MTRHPTPITRVYGSTEVARLFGVHPRTVTTWAHQGLWGAFQTLGDADRGGRWRFNADQVDAELVAARAAGITGRIQPRPPAYTPLPVFMAPAPSGNGRRFHVVEDPDTTTPLSRCRLTRLDPARVVLLEEVPPDDCCRRVGCRRVWHTTTGGFYA